MVSVLLAPKLFPALTRSFLSPPRGARFHGPLLRLGEGPKPLASNLSDQSRDKRRGWPGIQPARPATAGLRGRPAPSRDWGAACILGSERPHLGVPWQPG